MRFLPTRVHGIIDYLVAIFLVASPSVFRLPQGPASWLPVILGAATFLYSLFTAYEWGLFPWIPMRLHLVMDLSNGLLLASSPWLFGFADEIWKPHLLIGLAELFVTAVSDSCVKTRADRTTA